MKAHHTCPPVCSPMIHAAIFSDRHTDAQVGVAIHFPPEGILHSLPASMEGAKCASQDKQLDTM